MQIYTISERWVYEFDRVVAIFTNREDARTLGQQLADEKDNPYIEIYMSVWTDGEYEREAERTEEIFTPCK